MPDQQPLQPPAQEKQVRLPAWGLPAVLDRFDGNTCKLYVATLYILCKTLTTVAIALALAWKAGMFK